MIRTLHVFLINCGVSDWFVAFDEKHAIELWYAVYEDASDKLLEKHPITKASIERLQDSDKLSLIYDGEYKTDTMTCKEWCEHNGVGHLCSGEY